MAYPRRCPLCGADYHGTTRRRAGSSLTSEFPHATLRDEPGGTPSRWRPELPGRLLTLRCLACGGEYGWDYFGGRPAGGVAPPQVPQRAAAPRRRSIVLPGSRR